ncbi:dihydrofolate reductase [Paenibacillus aurantius]|uniref:Dihydrofolate reductase n=1 Tax=Paenibacillus aurantius TaxID=2918900 RepID=A0AA96LDV9_9BACL|nr:dihydrofolate reductase [Paenibacillus aurantius]WNQ10291.1 dihydrofolate reductase [Paenibacillus aurantius]
MISFIVAMDDNRGIGKNNDLPWRLPADLAYVKKVTLGKTLIMGRKTFDSMGKPLPGRRNVVLTRSEDFQAEGTEVVHSVDEALEKYAGGEDEVMIFGGSDIFKLFLPHADRMYITRIHDTFEADTFFPEVDESEWMIVSQKQGVRDEKNPYDYEFYVYERAAAPV